MSNVLNKAYYFFDIQYSYLKIEIVYPKSISSCATNCFNRSHLKTLVSQYIFKNIFFFQRPISKNCRNLKNFWRIAPLARGHEDLSWCWREKQGRRFVSGGERIWTFVGDYEQKEPQIKSYLDFVETFDQSIDLANNHLPIFLS